MLECDDGDSASHISDLLITVLQLSPPESLFLMNLCQQATLAKLLAAAFSNENSENCIAALSVLESLTARLCESINSPENLNFDDSTLGKDDATKSNVTEVIKDSVYNLIQVLHLYIPQLASQLQASLLAENKISVQTKTNFYQLGLRGLQLVKLLESIVRLGDSSLDNVLCSSGSLKYSIELFLKYELNSLLHLSVQRIICMILEGGPTRR
jgi:hypothetical protein